MKKEIKQKWVKALRSGKYKQGTGKLRSLDNKFCCLGVLYDLVRPDGWKKRDGCSYYDTHITGIHGVLPADTEIIIQFPIVSGKLMEMNDSGSSFEEIADWIEENIQEED